MGLLIGTIKKEYSVPNMNVEFQLNSLVKESRQLTGEVSSKEINIASTETYNFNIYEKPIFTIKGKVLSKEIGTNINVVIDTYYVEELILFGLILFSIIGLIVSLNIDANHIGTRKGEFFEIGTVVVFIAAIFGLLRVYKRRKKGESEMENLVKELKTFANKT